MSCEMCHGSGSIPGPSEYPHLRQPCQLCKGKEPTRFSIDFTQAPAGVPNRNNRVYSQEVLEKMAEQANQMAAEGRLVGQIGNPDDDRTNLALISHKALPKFRVEKGYLKGEFEVLDTPQGQILKGLLEENLVMRPRGTGSLNMLPGGGYSVGADYRLTGVDVSVEPPDKV